MAPFRPKRRAAEEEDDEEEELDEEDEELLAPGRAPGSDAPRPIVNVAGMSAAMEDFAWPASVAWVDTLVVQGTAAEDGEIANVQDDLERESVFHRRALDAVAAARSKLGALGVPTRRPDDFYAEMMKNDAHMRKVKDKLLFEQRELEAKGERRREREAKRYGKAVQAERLKERKQQQKDSMGLLQRMKKRGAGVSATDVLADEPDWGEPGQRGGQRQGRGDGQGGSKRQAHKAAKFGFGGPKRGSKRNDAASAADVSGYRTPHKPGQRGRGGGRGRGGRGRGGMTR